jgi:hypothetical protein
MSEVKEMVAGTYLSPDVEIRPLFILQFRFG